MQHEKHDPLIDAFPKETVKPEEQESFVGKDHPDFGVWDPVYNCWRNDH